MSRTARVARTRSATPAATARATSSVEGAMNSPIILFVATELATAERAATVARTAIARSGYRWDVRTGPTPTPRAVVEQARVVVAVGIHTSGPYRVLLGEPNVIIDAIPG